MKRNAWIAALGIAAAAPGQELWHNGSPAAVYGVYFMVPKTIQSVGGRGIDMTQDGRRAVFDAPNMNVQSRTEALVGQISATAKDVVYNNIACHYFDSTFRVNAPRETNIKNFVRRVESWIDFKGVTRRVRTYYEDTRDRMQIDAKFEKDTIEMDIVENGKQRHLSLNPAMGIEAFNCPIPEMMKNATKDRQEKIWCVIDPKTAGIVQYKLRLKGRFVPPVGSSSKAKGWTFEVWPAVGMHTMHVTEQGQMWQIEYADTSIARASVASDIGG